MLESFVYIIFFIFSIISYFFAPVEYSRDFCVFQFGIFVCITFFALVYNTKKFNNYLNFTSLFIIIYGLTTYLHSAFYINQDYLFSAYNNYFYNKNIINKSIAVAQIAISSFLIGTTFVQKGNITKIHSTNFLNEITITTKSLKIYSILTLLISIIWFLYVFFILNIDRAYILIYPKLTLLLSSLFVIHLILAIFYYRENRINRGILSFILQNKLFFLSTILFIIPFLYLSSRTVPSSLIIIYIALLHFYISKISISRFLLIFFLGLIIMAIVSMSRITDANFLNYNILDVIKLSWEYLLSSDSFVGFLLQDFIVNSRNLYDGINYTNSNDFMFGISYLLMFLAFIPFLPNYIVSIMGLNQSDVNSSVLFTQLNDATFGLGTHIVGDIYINFGLIGVIGIMMFLGYLITKAEIRKTLIYIILSSSFYGSVLMFSRISPFAWIELFYMLVIQYYILKFLKLIKT